MSRTVAELQEAIRQSGELPYGHSRTTLQESVVQEADAGGYEEVAAAARLAVIESYSYGGEPTKVFAPFTWLLARWDEQPEWWSHWEQHQVLWYFKWVTLGLTEYPEVPLERIQAGVEDMAVRYAAAGEGDAPVLRIRFGIAASVHGHEAAHEDYLRWVAAPRSRLSDCQACEFSARVRHLAVLGRHQEAADEAEGVLSGQFRCAEEPQTVIGSSLESMLLGGHAARAAAEHLRAVRLVRDKPLNEQNQYLHLLACARSGRLQHGLDLLEQWFPLYCSPLRPESRMLYAAAAGRLTRALADTGAADLPVQPRDPLPADLPPGLVGLPALTVGALADSFSTLARDLAARFDARNGTGTVGDRVEAMLAAGPLPDLPLDAVALRPGPATGAGRAGAGPAAPAAPAAALPEPEATDPGSLAAALDAAHEADKGDTADAVCELWLQLRDRFGDPGPEQAQAVARLELSLGGRLVERPGTTPDQVAEVVDRVVRAWRRVGEPDAVSAELSLLTTQVETGRLAPDAALAQAEQLAAPWLPAPDPDAPDPDGPVPDAPVPVAALLQRLVLVRLMAGADPQPVLDRAVRLLSAVPERDHTFRSLGALSWLLRIRCGVLEDDEALPQLAEAAALLPDGIRPGLRSQVHADLALRQERTDPDQALVSWRTAVADATRADGRTWQGHLRACLGRWLRHVGRPDDAVEELTVALRLMAAGDVAPAAMEEIRFDLARALLDAGRVPEAVAAAELAESVLAGTLAAEGISPAPTDGEPDPESGLQRPDVFLAAASAYAVAEGELRLGGHGAAERAAAMALRSAGWHRRNGEVQGEAEAWVLASRALPEPADRAAAAVTAADLADRVGSWAWAAGLRREAARDTFDTDGVDAALALLDRTEAALPPVDESDAGRASAWHRLALTEQRARVRAWDDDLDPALTLLDGLDDRYDAVDDVRSVRDVRLLRGQILEAQGDDAAAMEQWRWVLTSADGDGDAGMAQAAAERLAAALDRSGRPEEAEEVWSRYVGPLD